MSPEEKRVVQMMENSPAFQKLLAGISPGSHQAYTSHMKNWLVWTSLNGDEFSSFTPDDFVKYLEDGGTKENNKILDLKKAYLLTMKGRLTHKNNRNKAIKSFFAHNRVPLPRDSTLNLRGDKPPVRGELTPQNVRDILLSCNKTYRAIFATMFLSFMGEDEFIYWNETGRQKLLEDLKGDPFVVEVDLIGRKSDKNQYSYYTFIGPDALNCIKDYLKIRTLKDAKSKKNQTAIFLNQSGLPVTKVALYRYWMNKLIKLGLIELVKGKGSGVRYGHNPHEMRDVARTLWRRSSSDVVYAEFFMGHKKSFDEYQYDKIYRDRDETRKEYLKALPYLSVLSGSRPFKQYPESEVDLLRSENVDLRKQIIELQEERKEGENIIERMEKTLSRLEERVEKIEKEG